MIFWRNGVRLGTSQGRWFQDGPVWWYRDDDQKQTETGPIYNLIREERNIQAWGGTIGRTVRDGVVRIPLASINNPQFGEDEYWWYNGGTLLAAPATAQLRSTLLIKVQRTVDIKSTAVGAQ